MDPGENVQSVEFSEIGPVSFVRKRMARNIRISIKPGKGVWVTLPLFLPLATAARFVEEKRDWIIRHRLRIENRHADRTFFDENLNFQTLDHKLVIDRHQAKTIKTIIRNGEIRVTIPDFAKTEDERVQHAVRKAVLIGWRMEAERYLPEWLKTLSDLHALPFASVSVRNNKTRWGSCSRDNRISLNLHLIRLPRHLSEYVLLHELCHTVHKNHQQAFWNRLNEMTGGNAKKLDKELDHYSPEVF